MKQLFHGTAVLLLAFASLTARGRDLPDEIRAAQSSGNYERAAALYRELIASGQDTPEIRSNFAAMLHFGGHDREAVTEAQIALKGNPSLAGPNVIAGLSLYRLRQWKEALPYLERAHRQDPREVAPLIALGGAYVALRDYTRSNTAYLEASRLAPGNAEGWYGLGITYRSLADAAIKRSPPGTIPARARRLLNSALAALTKAVDLEPSSPRAHLILAESYRDSDKVTEAIGEYQTLLRLSPDDPAAELGLATTYWKSAEIENAIPLIEKVLRKLPADPEANGIMAQILVKTGEFHAAAPYAITALKGNPELIQVRLALAKIHLSENRPEQALAVLKRPAPNDPDGSYYYLLYRAMKMLGRNAEAAVALEEFKKRREASSDAVSQ
jgi:tetratricopeptide (TPR) repeat protein